jgi:Pilus formation protein N terminal region/SAF domain
MHTRTMLLISMSVLSLSALGAEPIKLFPDWTTKLAGPVESASASDPSIAEVRVTKDGLEVTGKKPGHTTVKTLKNREANAIEIEVDSVGWKLVPVIVISKELPKGTLVTAEMLTQRLVPEQLVTNSLVKPAMVNYILEQSSQVPLHAGDMVRWTDFASMEPKK